MIYYWKPFPIHPKSEQIGGDQLFSTEKVRISGRETFAIKVRYNTI